MIYQALSETKDLRLTGRLRKTPGACFTDLIKRRAAVARIRLNSKETARKVLGD
jgi:hypothetical protein